eukprot:1921397-Ditylum_brightwellii.AAC.1
MDMDPPSLNYDINTNLIYPCKSPAINFGTITQEIIQPATSYSDNSNPVPPDPATPPTNKFL